MTDGIPDGPGILDAPGSADSPAGDAASGPAPRRIAGAGARLIGDRHTACTHQVPASGNGERWCAFRRPGTAGGSELWVMNITRAAAGVAPACDGSSPDCLRLSTTLWTQSPLAGPRQPFANRFEGDTLFIHDQALSMGEEAFKGAISVWRPGWTAPRPLARAANVCYGDIHHPLAFCLDEVTHNGFVPVEFDLRAGSVAQQTGGPLPRLERVHFLRKDGEPSVHATFTDDGTQFVYSAPPAADAPAASLRVVNATDIGVAMPRTVLPDVMDWDLAKDNQAVYYLTDYDNHAGTLMVADFPAGTNPRPVPFRIEGYVILGGDTKRDQGIGVFTRAAAPGTGFEYRIVTDRSALDRFVTVFRYGGGLEAFKTAPDQRFTAYTRSDMGGRGFVARNDGTGECPLSPVGNRPPYDYQFLEDASLVFWAQRSEADPDTAEDGWMAAPGGCGGPQRFAARVSFYFPLGTTGLLFGADTVMQDGTVTLAHATLAGGRWPDAGPVRVADKVDAPVTLVGLGADRRPTHVLYQVTRDEEPRQGLFLLALPL